MSRITSDLNHRICNDESIVSILSQIDERFKVIEYLLSYRIGNLSIGTLRAIAENTGMSVGRAGFFLRLLEDKNLISRHRNGVFKLSNQLLALEILGECSLVNSALVAHPYVMVYRCKYDPDWTMEYASDGCIAITGYTPDYLLQNRVISFSQIIAPEYKDCWTEWERMIEKGLPFHYGFFSSSVQLHFTINQSEILPSKIHNLEANSMQKNHFPVIDPVATGENILRLRQMRGLSVQDLQTYFGFENPQAIYKWQRGQSLPSVDNLYALGALLHVPMDVILVSMASKPKRNDFEQQGIACCSVLSIDRLLWMRQISKIA